MSGRRARRERKIQDQSGYARDAIRTAERVLAVDFSDVVATHTRQVVVGWMRHAFEQSRVIGQLHLAGLEHAAAPNWRSLFETIVRLQWLDNVEREDRAGAVDAMLAHDKELVYKEAENLRVIGYESEDNLEEMESLVLEVTKNGLLKDQARKFFSAVKATQTPSTGLYKGWRHQTQYAHATAILGGAYAPSDGEDRIGFGRPSTADPDLKLHLMTMMLVVNFAISLLLEEGVAASKTSEVIEAYLS